MFVQTIDKLVAEFQQRLGTTSTVPWGWLFTQIASLVSNYPTGVTKAIVLSELECSWRKIEKLVSKGTLLAADSLQSIVRLKQFSPQAVFEVYFRRVSGVEATHTRVVLIDESKDGVSASKDSYFSMEMYLHQKLYDTVDQMITNNYRLRFNGCRLFERRGRKPCLLPPQNFVVLVDLETGGSFGEEFGTLEGLENSIDSCYIHAIKVQVVEISALESIHNWDGQTVSRIIVTVIDGVGIQAKFLFWEECLLMAKLFEEGDTLLVKQCFLVPDEAETFILEYGPETVIFCQPFTHEQEILPTQDGSKLMYLSKDNKGMLDCSLYPEQLFVVNIKQDMKRITLFGQVVFIGTKKLLRGEGIMKVRYEVRVQDESGACMVQITQPYKGEVVLQCGHLVLMKNLFTSTEYNMGIILHLDCDKNGEVWNLSMLQGWLKTPSLSEVTSVASLNPDIQQCVVRGVISGMQGREADQTLVQVHCSCQGLVMKDVDGLMKCKKCEISGMVEIATNILPKLFNLESFWTWHYNLSIHIMESEHHQLHVNITHKAAENLLQLSAEKFQALDKDGQGSLLRYTLGQQCYFGLSNFRGDLLVGVVSQI